MGRTFGTEVVLPNADPTNINHAARKKYVDDQVALRIAATEKGANSGVATLDSSGDLTFAQLPSHGHDASDLVSGILDVARLPASMWAVSSNTVNSPTDYNVNLTGITYPVHYRFTMNADAGLLLPTGSTIDSHTLRITAAAVTSTRTFTFNSSIRLSTGLTTRVVPIPAGQVMIAAMQYSSLISAWILVACTVSAT